MMKIWKMVVYEEGRMVYFEMEVFGIDSRDFYWVKYIGNIG